MWTWYLTRGAGAAALVLLTASVVIGVAHTLRWRSHRFPRFVVDDVHRLVSLLALAVVIAHVVTSVLDSFAPVSVRDAFVPFAGVYRPTWLGFGAIAFDLMLILALSSIWRHRLGYRAWRAIHWTSWACWPPALVHTLGTGSDIKRGWMLALALGCAGAVVLAVAARVWQGAGRNVPVRVAAAGGTLAAAAALALWLPAGPLAHGWALRAGTPMSLLIPKQAHVAVARTLPPAAVRTRREQAVARQASFTGDGSGVVRQGVQNGTALVDIALNFSSPEHRRLDVRIAGQPISGGGVSMERSQVTFGPPNDPARYIGQLTQLSGTSMDARVSPLRGAPLDLHADLTIDEATGSARGRVEVRPLG